MGNALIRIGDPTSHGGTVITGDATFIVEGQPVARIGDWVACRKCRGQFRIVSGAPNMTNLVQNVAMEGDKTECGAVLMAGQMVSTWRPATEAQKAMFLPTQAEPEPRPRPIAAEAPRICLECLQDAARKAQTFVIRG